MPKPSFTAAILAASLVIPFALQAQDIADLKRGMTATVTGTVERITDEDEFRLADDTGVLRVYIGPNDLPVEVGEKVTVSGRMDDDFGRMELYARSLIRADGSVVTFSQRYD